MLRLVLDREPWLGAGPKPSRSSAYTIKTLSPAPAKVVNASGREQGAKNRDQDQNRGAYRRCLLPGRLAETDRGGPAKLPGLAATVRASDRGRFGLATRTSHFESFRRPSVGQGASVTVSLNVPPCCCLSGHAVPPAGTTITAAG